MKRSVFFAVAVATFALLAVAAVAKDKGHTHAENAKASPYDLRQVMQHLSSSQQQIQTGLLMNNRLMVAKGAHAIAHHPMPKGGIKPYIKKNHAALKSTIRAMDEQVHNSAVSLFKQSSTASMLELQALNDRMVKGCISCHNAFRD